MPVPESPPPVRGFRRVHEETIFSGRILRLTKATYEAPDGRQFTREVVHHPGAVAVVPVTEQGVLLVRQFRGPVEQELYEIPAGTLDVPGEAPELTARRELREEAGVEATSIVPLLTIYNTPGFCDEITHLYMASGLRPCATDRHGVEEDLMTVVELSWDEAQEMVRTSAVVDAQTVLGLVLARERIAELKRA